MTIRFLSQRGFRFLLMLLVVNGIYSPVTAQTGGQISGPTLTAQSSEWEASAFNNGRRMVRDANGYFHAFWHSKDPLPAGPTGTDAHIFYSHTTLPASEPPSMASQMMWSDPVNLTDLLEDSGFTDHRYPSAAIAYEIYDKDWKNANTVHLVWQAFHSDQLGGGNRYEVLYASIPVMNPPNYGVMPLMGAKNLSQTPLTDSLVPSIAINRYHLDSANQHLHVVWQEEDINNGGNPNLLGDGRFSDIAYIRSTDGGALWSGPGGGWSGNLWDNITQTADNSQMPSVSCMLDQFTESPAQTNRYELGYNTNTVHVAYHEDFEIEDPPSTQIHIYYTFSPDDGLNWSARTDLTHALDLPESDKTEAYPCLAVDMLDYPHIAYMINNMVPAEPQRDAGSTNYLAGIHPQQTRSFPGPNPGMYGQRQNLIVVAHYNGALWDTEVIGEGNDNEFPTVALDRWNHLTLNYQAWFPDGMWGDYEILRHIRLNQNIPQWPVTPAIYDEWSSWINDSMDPINDDLFPNTAHKRVSVYRSSDEPNLAGYDEIWTKVTGHGPDQATSTTQMRQIWQDGNMEWLDPEPSELRIYGLTGLLISHDDPPNQTDGTLFGRVALERSVTNALSLVNPGPHAIAISGISTNGANAAEFGGSCVFSLPAASTNELSVNYDPVTPGAAVANLVLANNSRTPYYQLNLAGAGAYPLSGAKTGQGTISPEGEVLMLPGESTNFLLVANADHFIGSCLTNGTSVTGAAGLDVYSVDWNNIVSSGETYAAFMNVTNVTATNNTPYPWLRQYYTNEVDLSALGARAEEDSDSDGADGWEEHVMDTDPTDNASVLKVVVISNTPAPALFFESSTNRTYTLYATDSLTNILWSAVPGAGPRPGIGAMDSMSDTNSPSRRYYQIKVEP